MNPLPPRKWIKGAIIINLVKVTRLDSIRLDESFFTPEGVFVDTPKVTRTGIFEYKNPDGSTRRELRLPEHVFCTKSLASYKHRPVIITHDAGRIAKENIADETIGIMTSEGYRDSDSVRVEVAIHDIEKVKKSGLRELSLGYDLVLDYTPGSYNGQPYDAIQTNIVVNHLALVQEARAGDQAKLNLDSKKGKGATKMNPNKTMSSKALKKALDACRRQGVTRLDDVELVLMKELAELDEGDKSGADETIYSDIDKNGDAESVLSPEQKIKLIKEKHDNNNCDVSDIATLLECIEYLTARSDVAAAAKDAEKSDEGAEEKDGEMNADSVDAIISERIRLGRIGDRLNLDGLEELRPLDAKKAIVKAVLPTMNLDGKSPVYIQAAFDQAVEQVQARKDINYQRQQMTKRMDGLPSHVPTGRTDAQDARERMMNKMMGEGGDE